MSGLGLVGLEKAIADMAAMAKAKADGGYQDGAIKCAVATKELCEARRVYLDRRPPPEGQLKCWLVQLPFGERALTLDPTEDAGMVMGLVQGTFVPDSAP